MNIHKKIYFSILIKYSHFFLLLALTNLSYGSNIEMAEVDDPNTSLILDRIPPTLDKIQYDSIKKLDVTFKINQGFFDYLVRFENLEHLILRNCIRIESIPIDTFQQLSKISCLELYNVQMSYRCYFRFEGLYVDDLLNILKLPKLRNFTVVAHDLKKRDKLELETKATEKNISATVEIR